MMLFVTTRLKMPLKSIICNIFFKFATTRDIIGKN